MTQRPNDPEVVERSIAEDVVCFLRDHIESLEQLEILLWLRAHPDRAWSHQSIAAELRIRATSSDEALRVLCRENLLSVRVGPSALLFTYKPRPATRDELVRKLLGAYANQRLDIVKLITLNTIERGRTKSLRKFSDSFILAPKGKKGG